jgi:pyruvate-formate lyase-activating enzyme
MPPISTRPSILFVNPWIHDFSAYDFWMKPLGLLYIGALLRSRGCDIFLLDCLDFSSFPPEFSKTLTFPKRRDFGRGHFYKERIPKPKPLQGIPRHFRRYGVPPEILVTRLSEIPRPDLILVTSLMTYWYTGLSETITFLRRNFPRVPIFLGGVYATLCRDHARKHSGVDHVLAGPWDPEKMGLLSEILGIPPTEEDGGFLSWPYPAFDLYPKPGYVCVLTRSGCPFSCSYCASSLLTKGQETRPHHEVVEEVAYWQKRFGVKDFAFYDDALLINPQGHMVPFLKKILGLKISCNFHTPNALHVREIDEEVAELLFRGGFQTIRLGLETSQEIVQIETGGKVTNEDFRRAVKNLKKAGFPGEAIGVYLLAGLPGQRIQEVRESIDFVRDTGAKPILVEYSPIPGTPLFEKAKRMSSFDLENEPLYQNNSLFPCQWEGFTLEGLRKLKREL